MRRGISRRKGTPALRAGLVAVVAALGLALAAGPALACAGLVGPGGTVQLARTTTLSAYHDGVEHYVTSFEYQGGGAKFGSIVPLPGVPTQVEKAGDWTLQRLLRETQPVERRTALASAAGLDAGKVEVLQEVKVDALDLTVLRGGGKAVGDWARQNGFGLTPDAPEILDFYAERSPIFMAAVYDPTRVADRGQRLGDGTPVHLTIPTANPWVPLRILGLGLKPDQRVQADVFLLTDREPLMLPQPRAGMSLFYSEPASVGLLADLRSDRGMAWLPPSGMWLSQLRLDIPAGQLTHDLAVDADRSDAPSRVDAGLARPPSAVVADGIPPTRGQPSGGGWWTAAWWVAGAAVGGGAVALVVRARRSARPAARP
jgi:hypothetical protein